MASNLFIIEAPGKRRSLFDVLRSAGIRDIEIEATVGHLCANPEGLKPLGIDAAYNELAYRVRPDREHVAATIAAKAGDARRIYVATDDDQEGDVIARDVLLLCIPEEHRHKVVRARLRALAVAEVQRALREAAPLLPEDAWRGDARRVIDRLIGSLSGVAGAVGRVQGSLLMTLAEQRPVVGVVTHTLAAADGGAPFVARQPVFAGKPVPEAVALDLEAMPGASNRVRMSEGPMNYEEIVLSASQRTGASLGEVAQALQGLYEKGRLSYPRARDSKISAEALARLGVIGKANGAMFQASVFGSAREAEVGEGHEAPNPVVFDVPVNRPFDRMTFEDQVLVHVTQNLLDHGIQGRLDRPVPGSVPEQVRDWPWERRVAVGTRLWPVEAVQAGFKGWTREQSLLHLMSRNGLGRPSTVVEHVEKFLTRGLVTQSIDLTGKGVQWEANVRGLLGYQNIAKRIEDYIATNKNVPSQMVSDMVELFGLKAVKTAVEQRLEHSDEHERGDTQDEIPTWDVS